MQLRTVLSDGSDNTDNEFDFTPSGPDGPLDGVVIRCRALDPALRRKIERESVRLVKNPMTRGMVREPDQIAAFDEMVRHAVVSWQGITGADGQPLVCTDQTKMHLPEWLKGQVVEAASSGTEASTADSFRQSARVV